MKKQIITAMAVVAMFGICSAETINIAMNHGDVTVAGFNAEADGTVVSAGTNGSDTWNQVSRNGGDTLVFTGKALDLADGTSSGASLAVNAGYSFYINNGWGGSGDDYVMMEGWYGFNASETLTVSGLSSDFTTLGYNLTIYGEPGSAGRVMNYTIGSTTKTMTDAAGTFDGTFTEGVNFVTFSGLTGTDFTITGGGSARAAINGMIIESIPEPATMGLVALFGGACIFIRRRFLI